MKLALGRALYDPGGPMGKMFFNILATFAEFEVDLIRMRTREGMAIACAGGNCAASSPNFPTDSSGNSAACMPRASIPSATSPSSSPSQDQPSIAHSTGVIPLSVRSCPLPKSTRSCWTTARSVVMDDSVKFVIKLYSHEFNSPLVGRLRITETLGFVFYPRPARRHIMDHFL